MSDSEFTPKQIAKGIAVCILLVVVGFILGTRSIESETTTESEGKYDPELTEEEGNVYEGLREMALSRQPEDFGISRDGEEKIFGVIMDWYVGEGTITLVSYISGDASLYLNSGGGWIGGHEIEEVNKASKKLVLLSNNFISLSQQTKETPLPLYDEIIYYLLTNKGNIYTMMDDIRVLETGESDKQELFNATQVLISKMRESPNSSINF